MNPPVVLVLTADPDLAEPVHRLAAAAGVRVRSTLDSGDAWSGAPPSLVLVDPAGLSALPRRPWSRRTTPVHVVSHAPVADAVYRAALDGGAISVLALPDDLTRLTTLLGDLECPRAGLVVAVTGGSGGIGATTLAATLALRSAHGAPTMLVDLDPLGPGLGRVLGGTPTPGISWLQLLGLEGRLAAAELRAALPSYDGVGVLCWPDDRRVDIGSALVAEVVSAGARGHDRVVVDVPRGLLDRHTELLAAVDLVVLEVAGSVPAVASAARTLHRLRACGAPLGLAVRTVNGAASPTDVARVLETPVVAEVGHDRRVTEQVDLGLGPVRSRRSPLARAADRVLSTLAPLGETTVRSAS